MTARSTASLLPVEQLRLLHEINDMRAPVPGGSLDELVTGGAVTSPRGTTGHADLQALADAVAARLHELGVRPGDQVACALEPGPDQVVAVLGTARAGAVHVPVSPNLSQVARWQRITRTGGPVLLTQSWLAERLAWPDTVTAVAVDRVEPGPPPPERAARTAADAACLLAAENGETLVPVSHGAIATMATELNRRFGVSAEDRVFTLAPPESGFTLYETFGTLLAGATLVFGEDLDARDPAAWTDLLRRERITVWHSPPALLARLVDHVEARGESLPDTLRLVLTGGELFAADLARRTLAAGSARVVSLGAATVPGLWATCTEVDEVPEDWRTVPIGRPLPNQRIFALSESMGQCPVWVTGRLHFGGTVAQPCPGFDDPADDTRVQHPETGEPLVRTERFGRVLPDGVVEVTGAESAQVTVHGRPLNVQDTEVALAAHDAVREAAVVLTPGRTESLAFARLVPGESVTGEQLLDHLRRKVSPYLLPQRVEVVSELPLAPDGRIDRLVLAETAAPDVADELEAPPPVGDTELIERVTAVACRVLGVSDIEPNMNLLDLGATSIELVRLATVVEEELGVTVDVEELLRFPSVAVLVSKHLGEVGPAPAPVRPADEPAAGELLVDLVARQAFKDAAHHTRHEFDETEGIPLAGAPAERLVARRTHRSFGARPVEFDGMAELLGALRQIRHAGEPKRWYPSAGGAYPVQVYLVTEPGRVRDLPAGSYYHHPERNTLVPVVQGARVEMGAHAEINRKSAQEAAFAIYLIARTSAITPLYGDLSADFAVFEAGAMAQLLMTVATEQGLALCPVGAMDTEPLQDVLKLGPDDRFLHVLLGGRPAEER